MAVPNASIAAWIRDGMPATNFPVSGVGYRSPYLLNGSLQLLQIAAEVFLQTLLHNSPQTFYMSKSEEFAGQERTVMSRSSNHSLVDLALWAGARSCWSENLGHRTAAHLMEV